MRELIARRSFPELEHLESLIQGLGTACRSKVVASVHHNDKNYPLHCVSLGSPDPKAPVVGFFGGVHGLEKIGSEVVLNHLQTLHELLKWDRVFRERLKHSRLVFMPLINPVGIVNRTRSNGNGVDLMRNSPQQSDDKSRAFWRGHRFSKHLPYYQGNEGAEMEIESKALIQVVEEELLNSNIAIAVDVHSGFGARDRFWFPYAYTKQPFPYVAEAHALKELLDQTYNNHIYAVEPVSRQYTLHGDLWDYMFLENMKRPNHNLFIPFTLEMGSWQWLKKNPLHVFNREGMFHPMLPHRRSRILRRHMQLFDFLHRAVLSPEPWAYLSEAERRRHQQAGMELWYG